MKTLWQDIRYGLRMLRKSPGFTVVAVVTLAIGIGANTIMFSMSDLLLLRPMKVRDPEQLVCCDVRNSMFKTIPYSAYLTLRDSGLAFRDLMAQDDGLASVTLVQGDSARQVCAGFVSANYFAVLGVAPAQGRGFLPEEEWQGGATVVVLSHRAWQRLGADSKIVGQFISINGVRCQVVGVAPEGFTGVTLTGPDLWLPLGSHLSVAQLSRGFTRPAKASADRDYPSLYLVGRLKPGLNRSVAQAQLQPLVSRLREDHPKQWGSGFSLGLHRPPRLNLQADVETERTGLAAFSLVLMAVSAIILVIACMNLANMMMVQGAGRRREIVVRLALGGGRLRIIRQLLVESLLLALLGGAFGLVLAFWGTRILNVWIEELAVRTPEVSNSLRTGLSIPVLAATLGFSLVAALLFGLRPALGLSRRDLVAELKESGSAMLLPVRRKHGNFSVLCQIALAVVLVLGAALFTRSAHQLARPNPGYRLDNKLVVQIDPLSAGYDRARSVQFCETLADHLASLPGVVAVGTSPKFFFGGGGIQSIYEHAPGTEGEGSRRHLAEWAAVSEVGRDYFAVLELPLLQGRAFDRLDSTPEAEKVVIVDESLARKLRPDGKALGCLVQYGIPRLGWYSEPHRVVGIVPNVQGVSDEGKRIAAQAYRPVPPDQFCPYFYLRLAEAGSAATLKQWISEEIHKVDPRVPVLSAATLAQRHHMDPMVLLGRCGAQLAQAAGAAALFLAALGIYALKGSMVASRTTEIGIRMALGATRRDILAMVLREGIVLTLVGLFVGLCLALAAARVVRSALYGVSPVDPLSVGTTLVLLGLASLLAGYIPARRAANVDPMVALRSQ
jgi:predicted permease